MLLAIIAIVIAAISLGAAGRLYQRIGAVRDRKRYSAPGKIIETGSHRLHLLEMGEGSPTVIFESGLMSTVLSWRNIQPEIAKTTRAVCYDRAALGWSDAGPGPRDASRITGELHALLERTRIPPPYVLVGHSFGGLTTRLFAARYPDEVAGLVLLDPVVPNEWNPPSERDRKRIQTGAKILRRAAALSHWGLLRFVALLLKAGAKTFAEPLIRLLSKGAPREHGTAASPLFWNLPAEERVMAPVFWVQPKFTATIASQLENLPASAAQVSAAENLGRKPVTVISAADTPPQRLAEQIATARLSTNGKHLVATRSSHWIMADEPQLVLQAIRDVLEQVRRASEHPPTMTRASREFS